jgi:uncharacterized protein (TIGR02145 family)
MNMESQMKCGSWYRWSAAGILACAIFAQAATLPYQGLATDAKGTPIADGTYTVKFSLYGNSVSATSLWTETQSVTTHKGLFSTSLGAATTIPDILFNGSTLYLGVVFNGGTEGRSLLGNAPWAKAADSSRASNIADSSKSVAGLKDSLSALRAKIRSDSNTQVSQLASNVSALIAQHRTDSTTIYALQSMIAPPPSSGIPWQSGILYGTLTDSRDGQIYRTVRIGSQVWMAQNLNFAGTGSTIGMCYGNSTDSCTKYGRMYTWTETMAGATTSSANPSGVKGTCPTGWHVPSDAEWTTMQTVVDPSNASDGTKLKSVNGWLPYGNKSGGGTDTYGLRVLPAGFVTDASYNLGKNAYLWTATEQDASYAKSRYFYFAFAYVYTADTELKSDWLSLRCTQD